MTVLETENLTHYYENGMAGRRYREYKREV